MKKILLIAVSAPLVFIIGLLVVLVGIGDEIQKRCDTGSVRTASGSSSGLYDDYQQLTVKGKVMTKPQAENAEGIISEAYANKLPEVAAIIAIMVALQESTLLNLNYGYPGSTSLGLFQQIQDWGPRRVRRNPRKSAYMFYFGGRKGQAGLTDIGNWGHMPLGQAGQAVQRSAYPGAYDQHEKEARAIVAAYSEKSKKSSVQQVSVPEHCDDKDILEEFVRAALSREGDAYSWSDPAGAGLISAAARGAGFALPDTIDGILKYKGEASEGVSARLLDVSDYTGPGAIKRGDIVVTKPDRIGADESVYIALGAGPVSASGGKGSSTLNVATYNIKQGRGHRTRFARAKELLKLNELDVVGFQEVESRDMFRYVTSPGFLGEDLAAYPSRLSGVTDREFRNSLAGRMIVYNKKRLEIVATDEVTFNRMSQEDPQPAHAPIVWLRDKETGNVFVFINTHNPAYPRYAKERADAGQEYANKIAELKTQGFPIVFVGDFNGGFWVQTKGPNPTYRGQRRHLNYCQLTAGNLMRHARDVVDGISGQCQRKKGDGPSGPDHIYVSPDVDVDRYWAITKTLSDHDAVAARVVLKPGGTMRAPRSKHHAFAVGRTGDTVGIRQFDVRSVDAVLRLTVSEPVLAAGDGGSGTWVFPLEKGTYRLTSQYGPRHGSHHNGADFGTLEGTPPLAAMHSGKILRYGWDFAWGNYVFVETGVPVPDKPGMTYKYLYAHLSALSPRLSVGDTVAVGEYVGDVGDTGNSFGEHLHLVICITEGCIAGSGEATGSSVDPLPFMELLGIWPQ